MQFGNYLCYFSNTREKNFKKCPNTTILQLSFLMENSRVLRFPRTLNAFYDALPTGSLKSDAKKTW